MIRRLTPEQFCLSKSRQFLDPFGVLSLSNPHPLRSKTTEHVLFFLLKTINLVNKTVVVNTTDQQFMNLISSAFFIFHM